MALLASAPSESAPASQAVRPSSSVAGRAPSRAAVSPMTAASPSMATWRTISATPSAALETGRPTAVERASSCAAGISGTLKRRAGTWAVHSAALRKTGIWSRWLTPPPGCSRPHPPAALPPLRDHPLDVGAPGAQADLVGDQAGGAGADLSDLPRTVLSQRR